MSVGDNCGTCGGKHRKGACPNEPKQAPDVELQAVFSGRRGVVALEDEAKQGPEGLSPPGPAPGTSVAEQEIQPVRPAEPGGIVSIESLISHPDPFIASLASQLRARDSMLEAVRRAAQLAVEQSRKREKELDGREARIRDLSDELRRHEQEIAARERTLEERVSKVDTEVAERMRFVREWEAELEKRELDLAAAREEMDQERRAREVEVAAGDDRTRDLESFGRRPHPTVTTESHEPAAGPASDPGELGLPVSYADTGPGLGVEQPEFVAMTATAKTKEGAAAELLKLRTDLRRERARIGEREDSMVRKERDLEERALKLAEREARLQEAEQKWERRALRKEAREP
ncbi:MAG TPA: hypothetical protein VI893_06355 [Thermoplasmata archaeon]|nr:hypothetical protein [Thermoplasmata archaeon]